MSDGAGTAVRRSSSSEDAGLMIQGLRFNQDGCCFVLATAKGFRIFSCEPFRETFRREEPPGGGAAAGAGGGPGSLSKVEMLFRWYGRPSARRARAPDRGRRRPLVPARRAFATGRRGRLTARPRARARSNILALIGGGPAPQYPPNRVIIWDDHQERCIGELSFRSEVRNVKLRRDRIVVVLDSKCYVYNFENLKPIHQIETIADNVDGVCALSSDRESMVLACPGLQRGQVRLEIYNLRRTRFITAHESNIACMELNSAGTVLATASDKGTLVRVFDTMDNGTLLHELRRGVDRAKIHCLAFSHETCGGGRGPADGGRGRCDGRARDPSRPRRRLRPPADTTRGPTRGARDTPDEHRAGDGGCPAWLAATSDKGTVHVWSLENGGEPGRERQRSNSAASSPQTTGSAEKGSPSSSSSPSNPTSALSFFRGVLPRYFSSEWSFAHFRLPDASYSCVAFADPEKDGSGNGAHDGAGDGGAGDFGVLQVVTGSGGFLQLKFNKRGKPGESCEQTKFTKTMKA